jgi:hypothetical protein
MTKKKYLENDNIDLPERIVMTPKKKTQNSTTLMMERKKLALTPASTHASPMAGVHVAGGSNAGIIVNKQQIGDDGEGRVRCYESQFSVIFANFLHKNRLF